MSESKNLLGLPLRDELPSKYHIVKSGNNFEARDKNGILQKSNSDAVTVFQWVHDALPSNGGKVTLDLEQFVFTQKLNVSKALYLAGHGRATEIKKASSYSDGVLINIQPCANFKLKDALLWADKPSDIYGVGFNNSLGIIWYPCIENVMFININGVGSDNPTGGNYVVQLPKLQRIIIEDPYSYGFYVTNTIDGVIDDMIVFSSTQKQGTYGLRLNAKQACGYLISKFRTFRQGYGMLIEGDSHDTSISHSVVDLNYHYALAISNSNNVKLDDVYCHAPNDVGLCFRGSSKQCMAVKVVAKNCSTGIKNDTVGGRVQRFIGCEAFDSSVADWDITASDVVRGCLNKADQN